MAIRESVCGWHHPDRVEPGIPEVFQQAIRLTHVDGKLERAKHALALDSLKEQEFVVHQDTHHGTSRRDGGSVVSVDHQRRRPQAPSFRYVHAYGKRQKCGLPASVGFKKYEALLRWLCGFLLLYVVGSLRLFVFSTF